MPWLWQLRSWGEAGLKHAGTLSTVLELLEAAYFKIKSYSERKQEKDNGDLRTMRTLPRSGKDFKCREIRSRTIYFHISLTLSTEI